MRSVVYPIILDRFQPSFSWCKISQASTVRGGFKIGSVMENPWAMGVCSTGPGDVLYQIFPGKERLQFWEKPHPEPRIKKGGMTLPGLAEG